MFVIFVRADSRYLNGVGGGEPKPDANMHTDTNETRGQLNSEWISVESKKKKKAKPLKSPQLILLFYNL